MNHLGLFMVICSAGVGIAIDWLITGNWHVSRGSLGYILAGFFVSAADFGYRCFFPKGKGFSRFVWPNEGGHFVFIPLCYVGWFWVIAGVLVWRGQ